MGTKSKIKKYVHTFKDKKTGQDKSISKKQGGTFGSKGKGVSK